MGSASSKTSAPCYPGGSLGVIYSADATSIDIAQFKELDVNIQSDLVVCCNRFCCRCSLSIEFDNNESSTKNKLYYYHPQSNSTELDASLMLLLCDVCYNFKGVFVDSINYVRFYNSFPDLTLQFLSETVNMLHQERINAVLNETDIDRQRQRSALACVPSLSTQVEQHSNVSSRSFLAIEVENLRDELQRRFQPSQQVLDNINSIQQFVEDVSVGRQSPYSLAAELIQPTLTSSNDTIITIKDIIRGPVLTYSAHSVLLSARSAYFMTQLLGAWAYSSCIGVSGSEVMAGINDLVRDTDSHDDKEANLDLSSLSAAVLLDANVLGRHYALAFPSMGCETAIASYECGSAEAGIVTKLAEAVKVLITAMHIVDHDHWLPGVVVQSLKAHKTEPAKRDSANIVKEYFQSLEIEVVCLAWLLTPYFDATASTQQILTQIIIHWVTSVENVIFVINWCEQLLMWQQQQSIDEDCVDAMALASHSLINIHRILSFANRYLDENMIKLALNVDCLSDRGLISVSKEQLKRALDCDYLQAEDELTVLHTVVGWDVLQQYKYERYENFDVDGDCVAEDANDDIRIRRNSKHFVSDLSELLLSVRFALIPPDETVDLILAKETYSSLLVDHFLCRSFVIKPAVWANSHSSTPRSSTPTSPLTGDVATSSNSSSASRTINPNKAIAKTHISIEVCTEFWKCNFVVKKNITTVTSLMIRYAQCVPTHRLQERIDKKYRNATNYPILAMNFSRFRPRLTDAHLSFVTRVWQQRERQLANKKWASDNKHLFLIGAFHPLGKLIEKRR